MKTKTTPRVATHGPTEADIREYAHHLYVASGWLPGRDLENWLEAEACLKAAWRPRQQARPPRRRSIFVRPVRPPVEY